MVFVLLPKHLQGFAEDTAPIATTLMVELGQPCGRAKRCIKYNSWWYFGSVMSAHCEAQFWLSLLSRRFVFIFGLFGAHKALDFA